MAGLRAAVGGAALGTCPLEATPVGGLPEGVPTELPFKLAVS